MFGIQTLWFAVSHFYFAQAQAPQKWGKGGSNIKVLRMFGNVTLFGKTRLNGNIVVPFFHFNAFLNIENALGNIFIAF